MEQILIYFDIEINNESNDHVMDKSKIIIAFFLTLMFVLGKNNANAQVERNMHQLTDTVEISATFPSISKQTVTFNTLSDNYWKLGMNQGGRLGKLWLDPYAKIQLIDNPVIPQFKVQFLSLMVNLAEVKLYNEKGQIEFYEKARNLYKGSTVNVPYDQIPEGKYTLVVRTSNGDIVKQKLFIPDAQVAVNI